MDSLIKIALLVVLGFSIGVCLPVPPETAEVEIREPERCKEMCEHLKKLGCSEGEPLSPQITCQYWCEKTISAGMPLGMRCLLSITSCSQVEACQKPRKFQ